MIAAIMINFNNKYNVDHNFKNVFTEGMEFSLQYICQSKELNIINSLGKA